MSNYYKLDENKNAIPCSMEEWSEQLEEMSKNDTKHVAKETINNKYISTVWLGLNHAWAPYYPLHIFETMIQDETTGEWENYQVRYATWQEAEEGHKKAVEWVKSGCKE